MRGHDATGTGTWVTPSKVIAATRAADRRRRRPSRSGRAQQADGDGDIWDGAPWRPAAGMYSQEAQSGSGFHGQAVPERADELLSAASAETAKQLTPR
jgi:hypothetical protein